MAERHVVDAHALIWYVEDNPRLGRSAGAIMDDPASALIVPMIALAEACWVVEHGRSSIPSVAHLLADVDADPRIAVIPLDRDVFNRSLGLTQVTEMQDRLIVATALNLARDDEPVAVLTKDSDIRESGVVPVVW
jgi:PIN domain nuclease of toxin-antitoxin system